MSVLSPAEHFAAMMMLRIFAASTLAAVAQAGLTATGTTACGTTGVCQIDVVKATVADEMANGNTCVETTATLPTNCPCWGCADTGASGMEQMVADNTEEQARLGAALTVVTEACAKVCGLGGGPRRVNPGQLGDGLDMSNGMEPDANWCGEWTDRTKGAAGVTCMTSIFDAKGLLFLTIIGGALIIIFFQCSIMAIVALTCGAKDEDNDAKP